MPLIRPSAVNLALGYVLFGAIALVILAAPVWYAWQVTIQEGRVEILREDAQRQAELFRRSGLDGLERFIEERVGLQIAGERVLLLADAQHHVLAGNLALWPDGLPEQPGTYTLPVRLGGHTARTVLVRTDLPGGYALLVGRDLGRYAPVETNFWLGLGAAMALLAVVGGIGAVLIRRELMSRIQSLRQTVSAIMQGELSHRLQIRNSGDELDTLSQTINRMLDQIEQLVHGIRNVSNSIAHDLRTPLAELRARLEVLTVTRPAPAETFLEIEGAVSDVDRVIGIFNALLRLAEIDSGLRRSGFVTVDLAEVAAQAAEFYAPAAELKGVPLSFRGRDPLRVAGDPLLLAQAVSNLIDNALKYSSAGGRITVETRRREDGAVELTVRDNGPGIPDSDKPRATERFFRGDNSRGTPGVGLGLSLVDAVARLHGGVLELRDNHPGLRAGMVLGASGA
jgi:signal transduction histidine kinase